MNRTSMVLHDLQRKEASQAMARRGNWSCISIWRATVLLVSVLSLGMLSEWQVYRHCARLYFTMEFTVSVQRGFPVVTVPLPSRKETCEFTLRPYLQTVGDFVKNLKSEDGGIDSVSLFTVEGNRIAQSNGIDLLLQSDFDLKINDIKYRVEVPEDTKFPLDGEQSLSDVKNMIHKVYTSLNVDRHQLSKELELRGQLDQLKAELSPLETQRLQITDGTQKRTNVAVWCGMAFMSLQFGFFARLTWWEYSWDIMEPVTYFVTYGTSMVMFAYYILTRQEYIYPDARDRQYLNFFHGIAKRRRFDIDRYNHLKDTIAKVEGELERLHDPLLLNLPTPSPDSIGVLQTKQRE